MLCFSHVFSSILLQYICVVFCNILSLHEELHLRPSENSRVVSVAPARAFCLLTVFGSHFVCWLENREMSTSSLFTALCVVVVVDGVICSCAVHTNVR